MTWIKDGTPLDGHRDSREDSSSTLAKQLTTYSLTDVRKEDYGVYSCRATNTQGSGTGVAEKDMKLFVKCKCFSYLENFSRSA